MIVDYLLTEIKAYLRQHRKAGIVLFAPLPARLFPKTIREPDLLYVLPENVPTDPVPTDPAGYPARLDLVMEVVSSGADARKRDYEDKRVDYAKAGITEYWIVDPEDRVVTVLSLHDRAYSVASQNRAGDLARSLLLDGLAIRVDDILALGRPGGESQH